MQAQNKLAQQVIVLLQNHIGDLGFTPVIHFEFEGACQFAKNHASQSLNFIEINKKLALLKVDGELVAEYWKNQWEYVSLFNGQSPLKEAFNLSIAIKHLPTILAQQGVSKTIIKPVVWSGDQGEVAQNCDNVFINDSRIVHIPNAVQINISVQNSQGQNLVALPYFGEILQQCFINTSLACCLLYLAEEEAFDRLALKTRFGLAQELCSPNDISGGHQGSIALYRKIGKHNQPLGLEGLIFDQNNKMLVSEHHWQKTARIEHRLGASSLLYDPFVNVVFALLNLIDALEQYAENPIKRPNKYSNKDTLKATTPSVALPLSLYKNSQDHGAIVLFEQDTWFSQKINEIEKQTKTNNTPLLGTQLKAAILSFYQPKKLLLNE